MFSCTPLPRALLFDMDGTLTEPMLDFAAIKAEMGIGDRPILEAMEEMGPGEREAAQLVLDRHEERAAIESNLNDGCTKLLRWVHEQGIRSAIITRNSRKSADAVLARHGLAFEVLITREDGRFKPDPAPLLMACRRLDVGPRAAWMIGDGQYDVEAGVAAGIATVWISHGRARPFAAEPWRTVNDLHELMELFEGCRKTP